MIFIVIFKRIVEHLVNMLIFQQLPMPNIFHPQLSQEQLGYNISRNLAR